MADIKEFVVNDRRKFTAEGEVRPDAPPSVPKPPRPETLQPHDDTESSARLIDRSEQKGPRPVPPPPVPSQPVPFPAAEASSASESPDASDLSDEQLPPPPSAEQTQQAKRAFDATVDRLDTAIRATNPGMDHPPALTFERVIQSLYMQAMMQLGGAAAPGQQPQVDIIGARQTIDMLAILSAKTAGNLSKDESTLLDTALFELHMGFLEVTQALARQAVGRQTGAPPPTGGPSIVR
ncbi:MAG TPA: DUF1844 domain-containing protein [Acidobacteriaceae bacterium]